MNAIQFLFAHPGWERLGWTLLHFIWQGALLAAVFALIRTLVHDPKDRYLLACGTLAAMVAAPVATMAYLGGWSAPAYSVTRAAGSQAALGVRADFGAWSGDVWTQMLPWLVMLWLVGVLASSFRLTAGWLMTARLGSGGRVAAQEWQQTLGRLSRQMGIARPVKFLISPGVEAPAVIGWLRPVLLMPVGALTGLPREHVEALLAHELAHIRRHDYLVNVIQSIAEVVLFYHPAVWWVSAQIRAERELCCDDAAVATGCDALTYARALENFEACRPAHANAALAANGSPLRLRIRRLLHPEEPRSHTMPGVGAGLALAGLILAGMAAGIALPVASAQETVVNKATIWADKVRIGDMARAVRGLGVLAGDNTAEVKIAETQAKEVRLGQSVTAAFRGNKQVVAGTVTRIRPGAANGQVTVDVQVTGPLPPGVHAPEQIDVTIEIERLFNVLCVGRPVFATAPGEGTLFKIEPDGKSAVRTKVQFGRPSIQMIEVRSGLQPGDSVIVSDMSAYKGVDRVTLR